MTKSIETIKDELEQIMRHLPLDITEQNRRFYLAGYIDSLGDSCQVDEETRGELYGTHAL